MHISSPRPPCIQSIKTMVQTSREVGVEVLMLMLSHWRPLLSTCAVACFHVVCGLDKLCPLFLSPGYRTSGNPSRTPGQGFRCYPGGLSAECPSFTAFSARLSLSISVSVHSCALTPSLCVAPEHGCWLMQAWDAGNSWARLLWLI